MALTRSALKSGVAPKRFPRLGTERNIRINSQDSHVCRILGRLFRNRRNLTKHFRFIELDVFPYMKNRVPTLSNDDLHIIYGYVENYAHLNTEIIPCTTESWPIVSK